MWNIWVSPNPNYWWRQHPNGWKDDIIKISNKESSIERARKIAKEHEENLKMTLQDYADKYSNWNIEVWYNLTKNSYWRDPFPPKYN